MRRQRFGFLKELWIETLYCDVSATRIWHNQWENYRTNSSYTFQQDLAPWHTSKLIQEKTAKLKLDVLEWPAKSLDLNPIEILWSILNKKLAAKPIYSIVELRQRLEGKWNDIRQLSGFNLIDWMPDRVLKCLKLKESYFMQNCISIWFFERNMWNWKMS